MSPIYYRRFLLLFEHLRIAVMYVSRGYYIIIFYSKIHMHEHSTMISYELNQNVSK